MPSETHAETAVPTPDPTRLDLMREWLKRRLFDGVWNSALTIAAVAFLVWAIPPVVEWVFLDAVWGAAAPDACRSAEGACWAMIHAKYRLIVFGRYPFVEQWRPLLGMLILVGMVAISCRRGNWKAWLGAAWIAAFAAFFALMWGGFLGMTFVRSELWGGLPLTLLLALIGIAAAFPLSIEIGRAHV